MVKTSDLVFGCSIVRSYHPYIFRESSVTTFKFFKIQSQFLSLDVVLVVIVSFSYLESAGFLVSGAAQAKTLGTRLKLSGGW